VGVATDHVIESFRNDLWPGYKTGDGIEHALWAQFHPLEDALMAMGIATWPMVELEADDALASAAHLAARDARVERVSIWTPDKDLAQLRTNEPLFDDVDALRWRGPTSEFGAIAERMGTQRLYARLDGLKPVLHDARRHEPM